MNRMYVQKVQRRNNTNNKINCGINNKRRDRRKKDHDEMK